MTHTKHAKHAKHAEPSFKHLRAHEFSHLDANNETYLDYTGAGVYPLSLPYAHQKSLRKLYGNPHTASPASNRTTRLVESTRKAILAFFNASSNEYTVIFTPNATGAIKLVAEGYPFDNHSVLMLAADNHNSVLGIREYACRAGAKLRYIPLDAHLRLHKTGLKKRGGPSLLAYPAQSNFSGVKHSVNLIARAHAVSYDVLLDVAAFVPTNPLDLSDLKPEFVPISFYKMFGYPTGIGALITKHSALRKLRKRWFAGGTVHYSSVASSSHTLAPGAQAWEDGTLNFLAMPAVLAGLDFLKNIGMHRIRRHVSHLTEALIGGMLALTHSNGSAAVVIHGPRDMHSRGGTVAFDVLDVDARRIDANEVENVFASHGISIRSGCFCNPGCAERAYGLGWGVLKECGIDGANVDEVGECLGVKLGSLRVSLGTATVQKDVDRFLEVLGEFLRKL